MLWKLLIIVYYARRQQNHTDKTPKTQNYTTVRTSNNDKNTNKTSYQGTDHNRWSKDALYRRQWHGLWRMLQLVLEMFVVGIMNIFCTYTTVSLSVLLNHLIPGILLLLCMLHATSFHVIKNINSNSMHNNSRWYESRHNWESWSQCRTVVRNYIRTIVEQFRGLLKSFLF